jgi:hypothetical protein
MRLKMIIFLTALIALVTAIIVLVTEGVKLYRALTPLTPVATTLAALPQPVVQLTGPTTIPVPPTSLPHTSTEWPIFQDDFSNTEYDGKYNPSLWSAQFQPNCGKAEQRDGVLMLTSPESCPEGSLYTWTVDGFSSIEHIKSAGAKLMLSSDFKGRGGPSFGFSANIPAWGNGCFIRAFDDGRGALANCEAWTYGTGHRTVYRTDEIPVSYDKWYSFKIVTDPKEMKITYYLDGQAIGSYKPIDDAPGLREASFYAGVDVWHGANSHVTGYIDDVRFGP